MPSANLFNAAKTPARNGHRRARREVTRDIGGRERKPRVALVFDEALKYAANQHEAER